MRSSEQLAFAAVGELNAQDRRLVQAWRDLGNDWVTSLLNSGVLSRHGPRVHPADAARDAASERDEDLRAERQRRCSPPGEAAIRRLTAEHESAHALVAMALGARVSAVSVSPDGSGSCWFEKGTPPQDAATIALAGEIWVNEFRAIEFPWGDSGCAADRQTVAGHVDDFGVRLAIRKCREILYEHRSDVLALADRLEREGIVSFGEGDA